MEILYKLIFLILLGVLITLSARYLLIYFRLKKTGIRRTGVVKSFHLSRKVFSKNAAIPGFFFTTKENIVVNGTPKYSIWVEVIRYRVEDKYVIYYNPQKATMFVVENKTEVVLNILVMLSGLAGAVLVILFL